MIKGECYEKIFGNNFSCFFLISSFDYTTIFASQDAEWLTEIGEFNYDMQYDTEGMQVFFSREYGYGTVNGFNDEETQFILDIFSDDNLISDGNEITSTEHGYFPEPYTGNIMFMVGEYNDNWDIYFGEKNVLISITYQYPETIHKIGMFTYKDPNIYCELMSFIENYVNKSEDETVDENHRNNEINISDFEILYSASYEEGYELFKWGVCKFQRENELFPVIACFFQPVTEKIYYITDNIENNIVHFENNRVLSVENGHTQGIEYDSFYDFNFLRSWELTITDEMTVKSVIETKVLTSGDMVKTKELNMENYIQTGVLPKEFFSVNYTESKPITEQKSDEDNIKIEEIENEKTEKFEKVDETEEKYNENIDAPPKNTEKQPIEFIDVPETHWAYEEVQKFSSRGIVLGYGNGYFGVDDYVTYEHFALLLNRLLKYDAENKQSVPAVREDVIASVIKALGIDVTDVSENIIESNFSDCGNLKPENRKYIAKAIEIGLVVGFDGKLTPYDNITRAETVVLLTRAEFYK